MQPNLSFFSGSRRPLRTSKRGVAIILVLLFIVMLVGVIVAFFSRAMTERQISNSSGNSSKVDIFAEGAMDQIIGDLEGEISAGSNVTSGTVNGTAYTVYAPKSAADAMPSLVGSTGSNGLENLVKISLSGSAFYSGGDFASSGSERAVAVSSTSPSINGRYISADRWNKALFLPVASGTDITPITTANFTAPDWVLVSRDGSNPTSWNSGLKSSGTGASVVIGRYAYAIYHEGGLLDANVVGYPYTSSQIALKVPVSSGTVYKSSEALVNLYQLKNNTNGADLLSMKNVGSLVGWRNWSTLMASGSATGITFPSSSVSGSNYYAYAVSNTTGFLVVSGTLNNSQSDRMFVSRQQLIDFIKNVLGCTGTTSGKNINILNYLTTFSRDINQPSCIRLQSTNSADTLDYNADAPCILSATHGGNSAYSYDDKVNPSFLRIRVSTTGTRNDGSNFMVGEPLVKKRFALNRLAWLTYKGPSAERNTSTTGTTGADGDIGVLKQYGITEDWLKEGTAANIKAYFGLFWDGSEWKYNVHNGDSGSASTGAIAKLETLAGLPREPDFFELLKASINAGSLGRALVSSNSFMGGDLEEPFNYAYYGESSVDLQILQIGANIISQYQPSNYPPRIVFDDGSGQATMPRTIVGVTNLPYFYGIINGVLQVAQPSVLPRSTWNGTTYTGGTGTGYPGSSGYSVSGTSAASGTNDDLTPLLTTGSTGVGAALQVPIVWNPHDPSSSLGAKGPTELRVVADSATPDQADDGTHNKIMVYAASINTTASSGSNEYSYQADSSSPGYSWYGDSSATGESIAHEITAENSAITLTTSGTMPLFSEPTMLATPGSITDSASNTVTVAVSSSSLMQTDTAVKSYFQSGGLPNYFADSDVFHKTKNASYIGFYLGAFPMEWIWMSGTAYAPLSAAQSGVYIRHYTGESSIPAGTGTNCYFTYRMQYKDSSGNWVTYDTKYGKTFNGVTSFQVGTPSLVCGYGNGSDSAHLYEGNGGYWGCVTDPRTSRFGLLWTCTVPSSSNGPYGSSQTYNFTPLPAYGDPNGSSNTPVGRGYLNRSIHGGWLDVANGVTLSLRPDSGGGWFMVTGWPYSSGTDGRTEGWMAWLYGDNTLVGLQPGMLEQNNASAYSYLSRYYKDACGQAPFTPQYFADPDGMVRRAMGGFVPPSWFPAKTTVGLPMARAYAYSSTSTNILPQDSSLNEYSYTASSLSAYLKSGTSVQMQSRPYMLHRPFQTVGELGYVFSDTPWRSLDFSTAESGVAALLDVFCMSNAGDQNALIAGKVNLNTRQVPVLKTILTSAYLDPLLCTGTTTMAVMDGTNTAAAVAQALVNYTSGTATGQGPLKNVSELVGRFIAKTEIASIDVSGNNKGTLDSSLGFYDGKLSYSGFSDGGWTTDTGMYEQTPKLSSPASDIYSAYQNSSTFTSGTANNGTQEAASYIQRYREAPIRALAAVGQARVWNLMIDVVAQIGRYPSSAKNASQFLVEGEQRYWVHVAIDRMTGQVVDKQVEVVKE